MSHAKNKASVLSPLTTVRAEPIEAHRLLRTSLSKPALSFVKGGAAHGSTSSPRTAGKQRGYALLIMLVLVAMGILLTVVSQLSLVGMKWGRSQGTQAALLQAKEALIGYALKYREDQTAQGQPDRVYGYLPLPDLGSSRNNNISCSQEGCDANIFSGIDFDNNGIGPTVIGRFPWRTLGTEPLRDSNGECLWLIVSSLHGRIQRSTPPPVLPPMNWDTLGQLDIVVANGSNALVSALTSAHDRPVAVIFSPGPPLLGQDRSAASNGDDVGQCGGNYDAKNYLEPAIATALGGVTNYLSGTNSASGSTGDSDPSNDPDIPKALSIGGAMFAQSSAYIPNACSGGNCALVANDIGLPLTNDELFGAIRKSSNFRTDINAMLDRMTFCLRDKIAAGSGFTPAAISGFAPPADKSAGRIADDACYGDDQNPLDYYSHYKEMIFDAKPNTGNFTVNGDSGCTAVLLFASQRGASQQRVTAAQKNMPYNYLEDINLSSFTGIGTNFFGDSLFGRAPAQAVDKDIVRCIPAGAAITTPSPSSPPLDFTPLVAYDAASRTLTLGKENVTGSGASAAVLFGCAWVSDVRTMGNGLRAYFNFQFKKVGTSVGSNGFVFALADAVKNTFDSCGAAGSHLGYSGDNGITLKISAPKIGIEFDQGRNAGFSENADPTLSGRNDPCGTSGCGGTVGYNSHAAIVYWGHDAVNLTDGVNLPDYDDNVHGFPSTGSLPGATRPPPQNPSYPSSGIAFKNMRGQTSMGGDSFLFHVRVEITPTRNANVTSAELSNISMKTEVWIQADSTAINQIAALKNTTRPMSQLYPGYASTLLDTATLYDVAGDTCNADTPCLTGQACGTDNICYRPALQTMQIGFTGSQRTTDQEVNIGDYFTTWIP